MITLSKDMETGVGMIDSQHKELIDRINDVTAMGVKSFSAEEAQKTIDLLGEYIIKHFGDEEKLQAQSGYPKFEWHKEQHQIYINGFEKLKKEFEENGYSAKFTIDLNSSIIKWIVQHIKSVDVEFGKFYNTK